LHREITSADELPVYVFGLLARDKYQLATPRDNDLSVHCRSREVRGIDAFERHVFAIFRASDDGICCQRELL
jgi:hypothetical protein